MLLAGSLLLFVQNHMGYAGQNSECRMIDYLRNRAIICFPEGTRCFDPHGIGDGVPVERDCWSAISRMCHPGVDRYPGCRAKPVRRGKHDIAIIKCRNFL